MQRTRNQYVEHGSPLGEARLREETVPFTPKPSDRRARRGVIAAAVLLCFVAATVIISSMFRTARLYHAYLHRQEVHLQLDQIVAASRRLVAERLRRDENFRGETIRIDRLAPPHQTSPARSAGERGRDLGASREGGSEIVIATVVAQPSAVGAARLVRLHVQWFDDAHHLRAERRLEYAPRDASAGLSP